MLQGVAENVRGSQGFSGGFMYVGFTEMSCVSWIFVSTKQGFQGHDEGLLEFQMSFGCDPGIPIPGIFGDFKGDSVGFN